LTGDQLHDLPRHALVVEGVEAGLEAELD